MRNVILGLSLIAMATSSFAQKTASKSSPVANPPLFIVLGSDDNTRADAIKWMQSVIDNGTNADGTTKRYMSFYVNTDQTGAVWNRNGGLVDAVYNAYKTGHEIGNHTSTHIACVAFDKAETIAKKDTVRYEIERARDVLESAGIPREHQFGFRTPYLRYSSFTFDILKDMGFLYDCSINATDTTDNEIGMYNFPYTMSEDDGNGNFARDNWEKFNYWGEREGQRIARNDDLWALPCMRFAIDPIDYADIEPKMKKNAKKYAMEEQGEDFNEAEWEAKWKFDGFVTGLDYNMWNEAEMDEDQTVRSWLQTVKNSLNSNRAPVTIGIHSQYYFESKEATYPNMGTAAKKQSAFERFVEEASKMQDVYFVSGDMVIRWMQNPCSAANFKPENYHRSKLAPYTKITAPTKIRLSKNSVNEGETTIGTLTAVNLNANITHTYEVIEGSDMFKIEGNELKFISAQPVNVKDPYLVSIRATASDNAGSVEWGFGIWVDKKFETNIQLIGTADVKGSWSGDKDGIGSTSKVNNQEPLEAEMYLAPHKVDDKTGETAWPYVSVGKKYTYALTGLEKMLISYTSDKDINVSIGAWTAKLGFGFEARIPAGTYTDFEVTPDMFVVTYTSSDAANAGRVPGSIYDALDFAGNTISFAGIEEGSTTTISVSSFRLIGVPNEKTPEKVGIGKIAVKQLNPISFNGISASKLNLNVAKAGVYSVDIFSVSGKRLFTAKTAMTAGTNQIQMPKNLAKGVAIIRVSGLNAKIEQKMLIK